MRTVDPVVWSKRHKKPGIQVSRCNKFGQHQGYKYEIIFRESLVDTALEYWQNCSVPVVKYFNKEDNCKGEKYIYGLLLVFTLLLGIFVVSYNCHAFYIKPPLVVNSQNTEDFIADVSFPAVALCSNNIISRTGLENYTEYLFNHNKNQEKARPYTRSEIEKNLKNLGALLMLALPPLQLKFDRFLHDVDPNFNVTDIMFKFTPKCSSMLLRCSWRGRVVPCETIFASRVTPLGFCCVFNARYYPADANNKPYVLNLTGQNYGLGVVMSENREDFMYVRRNVYGAEMLLFEGSEYPLLEGGDVRLYPIARNHSLYVNVRAVTQYTNDDVKYYSEEWRGCRTYSAGQSWCLWRCRRDTAAALCDCVPYSLHAAAPDARRVCGLRDLACLNKHREKFMYLYPGSAEEDDPHLSEELQDGLFCTECLVMCHRQLYAAFISYSKYAAKGSLFLNFLTEGLSLVNATTIRIFYNTEHHEHYSLEAYARWYEVIVKLSTQWTVVAGISVIAVVELLYHFTFRLLHHFVRRVRLANLEAEA